MQRRQIRGHQARLINASTQKQYFTAQCHVTQQAEKIVVVAMVVTFSTAAMFSAASIALGKHPQVDQPNSADLKCVTVLVGTQ